MSDHPISGKCGKRIADFQYCDLRQEHTHDCGGTQHYPSEADLAEKLAGMREMCAQYVLQHDNLGTIAADEIRQLPDSAADAGVRAIEGRTRHEMNQKIGEYIGQDANASSTLQMLDNWKGAIEERAKKAGIDEGFAIQEAAIDQKDAEISQLKLEAEAIERRQKILVLEKAAELAWAMQRKEGRSEIGNAILALKEQPL